MLKQYCRLISLCSLLASSHLLLGEILVEELTTQDLLNCGCVCYEEGIPVACSNFEDCDCDTAPPPFTVIGEDEIIARECGLGGVWLPEDPVLFEPLLADPRQIVYSVGWRFNDQIFVKNVIDVSYGDSIPIYRWFDIGFCGGLLQIDLEGALWAIFDPCHFSSPLINADYYVGFPLTYSYGPWSARLRGFHISSHIGDEFLMDHPSFDRRNASAEYVDFFLSNQLTDDIRVYGGLGYIVSQDDEFKCSPFYAALGTEVKIREWGFTDWCNQLYGKPFMGMHFRFSKDYKHHLDQTYVLGYEFGKLTGLCRKVRFYMEYHDGYSLEGQFCKMPTNYFSLRMSYGF